MPGTPARGWERRDIMPLNRRISGGRPNLLFLGAVQAGLLLVCLMMAGCDEKKPAAAQASQTPPTVVVAAAERQPVTQTAEFVGRVEAIDKVEIRARVTGFLD